MKGSCDCGRSRLRAPAPGESLKLCSLKNNGATGGNCLENKGNSLFSAKPLKYKMLLTKDMEALFLPCLLDFLCNPSRLFMRSHDAQITNNYVGYSVACMPGGLEGGLLQKGFISHLLVESISCLEIRWA